MVSGFLRPHASGFLRPHAFASAGEEPAEEIEDPFALNDAMLKERLEQAKASHRESLRLRAVEQREGP